MVSYNFKNGFPLLVIKSSTTNLTRFSWFFKFLNLVSKSLVLLPSRDSQLSPSWALGRMFHKSNKFYLSLGKNFLKGYLVGFVGQAIDVQESVDVLH